MLFILSERTHHENVLQNEADPQAIVAEMADAASTLINANSVDPAASKSTLLGSTKDTIPLDLESFKWLAKVVNNLT